MLAYIERPRPRPDASRPPLARAPLDSRVDDVRHARRRWLALVRHGLIVLLFGGPARFRAVGAGALAAGAGIALFLQLKKAAGRRRPCAIAPHCWATLLPPDQFSFPSGHTITAFAVAVSLGHFYPDLGIGLLFCALSVAASRILLGMHFLSDVVAGAAIGTILALSATAVIG